MKIHLFFGGEAITVPSTSFGLAYAIVSVWVDGVGFTSASNSIGSIGYICLETEEVDLGEVDADTQRIYSNLHATVVSFTISPNLFVKDGGIARISLSVSVQESAELKSYPLSFQASACRGVSVLTSDISFTCEMLQGPAPVAMQDDGTLLSDDTIAWLADQAPPTTDSTDTATV